MGRTEFRVNLEPLEKLEQKFTDPALIRSLNTIAARQEVAALVAQAISDNFDKEGPGWQALKGSTIRLSVAKSKAVRAMLKHAQTRAAYQMGAVRQTKSGKSVLDKEMLRGQRKKYNSLIDKELEQMERDSRVNPEPNEPLGNRQILRRTSLLFQTVTTPGASGVSESGGKNGFKTYNYGQNINRVEGTNLVWGTNLIYAAVHNYGYQKRNIPKREFLVLRDEWKKRLNEYVKGLMDKMVADHVGSK